LLEQTDAFFLRCNHSQRFPERSLELGSVLVETHVLLHLVLDCLLGFAEFLPGPLAGDADTFHGLLQRTRTVCLFTECAARPLGLSLALLEKFLSPIADTN
jgi:hypothetical protein